MKNSIVLDLPVFSKMDMNQAKINIETCIEKCYGLKNKLLKEKNLTWNNFIYPLKAAEDVLSKNFGPLAHLNAVKNTIKLREIYQDCLKKISDYSTNIAQSREMFDAYMHVLRNDDTLDQEQIKAINDTILQFKLSGTNLNSTKRRRLESISTKLVKLQSDFSNNVLDATMEWRYCTNDESELQGLSDHVKKQAYIKSKKQGISKKFVLGLDAPTYVAVMQQVDNRNLREFFYKAYVTRASNKAKNKDFDNTALMKNIVKLRDEKAKILGLLNYAELSLATKMVESPREVMNFLHNLLNKVKPCAEQEIFKLNTFALNHGLIGKLKPWDVSYYSEKMKKKYYKFNTEDLREYFPLTHVIEGLFKIFLKLYGIKAYKVDSWDKYHSCTDLYKFYDKDLNLRGAVLVDLFARENKQGGAWMDECCTRYKRLDGSIQYPIAYVVCNFMPPEKEGVDALLTHDDVLTLFHEFGHALQHILTKVDHLPVSGINGVEWDAVELPSQLMENFCWCEEGLKLLSQHVVTQKKLPEKLVHNLINSRRYQVGIAMLRQLEFAIFDMELHQCNVQNLNIHKVTEQVQKSTALLDIPSYNRFENSFLHIFSGGYAAGYYSYKWAEVLSSDVFEEFKNKASILNATVGKKFMETFLERGGSVSAVKLFKIFKGREPSIDALLRLSGLYGTN